MNIMPTTFAPWRVFESGLGKLIVSNTDFDSTHNGGDVAVMIGNNLMGNAILISAAPELLAAAKTALAWYEPRLSPGEEGPICNQLRAAIDKAEGRTK
jgi:hypothetical protein